MSSIQFPLRQSGIYRNLPSFDPSLKDLKALVLGATGISGIHTIRALLDTPGRWSKVYAVSRSPLSDKLVSLLPEEQHSRIQHVSVDMTSSAESIAEALRKADVSADVVFYYAYLSPKSGESAMDPKSAEELVEANVPPFKNFLRSLPLAGIRPKRILLQTGGKNYGMHIGRVRTSLVESDPQPSHLQPNFYYPQEDALRSFCEKHPETKWNIIHPFAIIGATGHASMNAFLSFGVYAAVQAHKGKPLKFGGDFTSWQFEAAHSTARLTGYLSEWAVLEEKCANQSFNAQDGGLMSWDRFFHELARWYGVAEVQGPELDESKLQTTMLAGGKDAPLGYGPPTRLRHSFTLAQWASDHSVKEAWEEIMANSSGKVTENPWDGNLKEFFMGDFAYLPFGTPSMNKARRYGFCGFVDTLESVFEMFQEMEKLGTLPPMVVNAAQPQV
ncbi:nad dependent epimerase dehydratase family protein [Stagonosporopsis vannaccii]|nr:nad dependent epimerase dehydratase family protein [Stagonosporopsis vannaccii]